MISLILFYNLLILCKLDHKYPSLYSYISQQQVILKEQGKQIGATYFIVTSSKMSPFFGSNVSAFSSSLEYSLFALQLRKLQVFILLCLGYMQETNIPKRKLHSTFRWPVSLQNFPLSTTGRLQIKNLAQRQTLLDGQRLYCLCTRPKLSVS